MQVSSLEPFYTNTCRQAECPLNSFDPSLTSTTKLLTTTTFRLATKVSTLEELAKTSTLDEKNEATTTHPRIESTTFDENISLTDCIDVTIPNIKLFGDSIGFLESGTKFIDPGYSCIDKIDGDITQTTQI